MALAEHSVDREFAKLLLDLRGRHGAGPEYIRALEAALRERLAINLDLVMTNARLKRRISDLEKEL